MKILFLITFFIISSNICLAQIYYSPQISTVHKKLFVSLESDLKKLPFTYNRVNDNDSIKKPNSIDTSTYAFIFKQYFDTAAIKKLENPQTYFMKLEEERNWLLTMTCNNIIAIHNVITCVKESILFVMPAAEYVMLDNDDERFKNISNKIYLIGYMGGGFYYPCISILVSTSSNKIIYLDTLINFEDYKKEKRKYFETYLEPIIAPCLRTHPYELR